MIMYFSSNAEPVADDPLHHLYTGELTRNQVCNVCNERLTYGENEYVTAELLPCEFVGLWCKGCGRVCLHEGVTYTESSRVDTAWTQTIEYDNDVHLLGQNIITEKKCDVCGSIYDSTIHVVISEEACTYVDGSCTVCCKLQPDPDCAHESTTEFTRIAADVVYTPVEGDAQHHARSGKMINGVRCNVCGYNVSVERSPLEDVMPCRFFDGTCIECGRQNTCDHPDTSIAYLYYGGATTRSDDHPGYHLYTGELQECRKCSVCHDEIPSSARREVVDELVPCEFEDGDYCIWCGSSRP